MNPRIQRICLWCGPGALTLLFGGLIVAGWFPPPSPHSTDAQVAQMFQAHGDRIRLGCLMIACAGAFTMPFFAVISTHMKRVEGGLHPLAYIQLACGAITVLLFTIPTFMWQAAAYDPHRNSGITHALFVAGWLPFINAIFPAIVQNLSIAAVAFTDKRATPIFPRWVGYMNVWVATGFIPSGLVLFFHHGPFAWNGIFTFWLAATIFGGWFIAMMVVLFKAIAGQQADAAADVPPAGARSAVSVAA